MQGVGILSVYDRSWGNGKTQRPSHNLTYLEDDGGVQLAFATSYLRSVVFPPRRAEMRSHTLGMLARMKR